MVKTKSPLFKCSTTATLVSIAKVVKASQLDPSPLATLPGHPPAASTMEVDPPSHNSAMEVEAPLLLLALLTWR